MRDRLSWMAAISHHTSLALMLISISMAATLGAQSPKAGTVPDLLIETPAEFAAARERVESFDRERLSGVMRLVGLTDPGPPIRVFLASEDSKLARQVPSFIAGFAAGAEGLVVLFPSRSPAYPDDTLEDVLHHEVAHVLITRASGGRPLPTWFHEGLATTAERTWGIEDQARVLRERAFLSRTSLHEVNELFGRDEGSRGRAYALAGAFVRDLIHVHGPSAPGNVMRRVAAGESFDGAFEQVTRQSVADAEGAFWDRYRFWARWGPFLMTSSALWMIVTLIALLAIIRRRQKRAALRKRWADEGLD
jgi:hypothetical protein